VAPLDGCLPPSAKGQHPTDAARQVIQKLATNRLRAFKATIDPATGEYLDDPYAQNKSLSEHVAADYHGRFLIELIQNGNDAHPRDQTNGEIEVLLADEGQHGTIYVANRGSPFSQEGVFALSRIGKSSKPPGEAIGNKGLGFRSVCHVCDAPEIYSKAAPARARPAFDGFCFALEHGSSIVGLFDDPRISELACKDLPMFSVPRWLPDQPRRVRTFAERGFATVVRLVLRDEEARKDALGQFRHLANQAAPTLLFMERLCRLTAVVEGTHEAAFAPIVLKRCETPLGSSQLALTLVDLEREGRSLVTKERIPETDMRAAIEAGVAAAQLHSSWSEWSGDGEVALAVRIDNGPVSPRLYTFLPMGDAAAAPFHGYLHGSFFPSSNRKAIDANIELNRLLLRKAASLAAATIRWLARGHANEGQLIALGPGAAARAAVDLLVWKNVSSLNGEDGVGIDGEQQGRMDLPAELAKSIASADGEFADAVVVPCLAVTEPGVGEREPIAWSAPRSVRFWSDASETFTVGCLADHGRRVLGIAPLWPGLGEPRAKRLVAFLRAHASGKFVEKLTPLERAEIAASVAASLPRGRKMPVARWTAFYRDLVAFMEGSPWPLAGHNIILCGDHTLRGRSENRGRERRVWPESSPTAPSRREGRAIAVLPTCATRN
jgi:hypothetical protein